MNSRGRTPPAVPQPIEQRLPIDAQARRRVLHGWLVDRPRDGIAQAAGGATAGRCSATSSWTRCATDTRRADVIAARIGMSGVVDPAQNQPGRARAHRVHHRRRPARRNRAVGQHRDARERLAESSRSPTPSSGIAASAASMTTRATSTRAQRLEELVDRRVVPNGEPRTRPGGDASASVRGMQQNSDRWVRHAVPSRITTTDVSPFPAACASGSNDRP